MENQVITALSEFENLNKEQKDQFTELENKMAKFNIDFKEDRKN